MEAKGFINNTKIEAAKFGFFMRTFGSILVNLPFCSIDPISFLHLAHPSLKNQGLPKVHVLMQTSKTISDLPEDRALEVAEQVQMFVKRLRSDTNNALDHAISHDPLHLINLAGIFAQTEPTDFEEIVSEAKREVRKNRNTKIHLAAITGALKGADMINKRREIERRRDLQ